MSGASGEHDDEEDSGKKDGIGVPQLILETVNPTESQADAVMAKKILPSGSEVTILYFIFANPSLHLASDHPRHECNANVKRGRSGQHLKMKLVRALLPK